MLTSTGAGAPAFSLFGQSATTGYGSLAITLSSASGVGIFYVIPGVTQTVTVPANTVAFISSDGGMLAANVSGGSVMDFSIFIDGAFPANGGYERLSVPTNSFGFWSFSQSAILTAGSHTIQVGAAYRSGNSAIINGDVTSVLQGEITVVLIKQ